MRPLCSIVMYPSSMSMLGVPYSPIVPSLMRWHSGAYSLMAYIRLMLPMTLLVCVNTARVRSIME